MKEVEKNKILIINGESISYRIIFSNRRTTCIMIHPNQSVIVRAPLKANRSDIEEWIHGRIPWIHKHIEYFRIKEAVRPKNKFSTGEHHFYLGNKKPIRILKSQTNGAAFHENEILIHSKTTDSTSIERIFKDALKTEADAYLSERLKFCYIKTKKYSLPFPDLRLRWMKSRWGSCSITKGITLNIRLMHLSEELIDHVILHELCHLRVQNHGRDFYKMLIELESNWKINKMKIHQMAPMVLPHA
jgi:hypothetical protein